MTNGDVTLLLRALLAAALGFAVGWEREAHGHAAGVRTVSIVALAASALTTLAQISFATPDRIVANIIVSVGFLGAGMILRGQRGEARGLTTAAAVWSITIVGMVVGLGHYLAGVVLTGGILLLLWWQYVPWLARLLLPPAPPLGGAQQRQRAPSPAQHNHAQAPDDNDGDAIHDTPDTPDTHETPHSQQTPGATDTRRPS